MHSYCIHFLYSFIYKPYSVTTCDLLIPISSKVHRKPESPRKHDRDFVNRRINAPIFPIPYIFLLYTRIFSQSHSRSLKASNKIAGPLSIPYLFPHAFQVYFTKIRKWRLTEKKKNIATFKSFFHTKLQVLDFLIFVFIFIIVKNL